VFGRPSMRGLGKARYGAGAVPVIILAGEFLLRNWIRAVFAALALLAEVAEVEGVDPLE
jgi:hypothetical protein